MSEKNKFCPNCGAAVEGKEFCPQCGAKQSIDAATPQATPILPTDKVVHEQSRGAMEHLTIGFNVAMNKPSSFSPSHLE
jgi:uncharacterized membrane protein YvbJ